jgi:hypothetical protein
VPFDLFRVPDIADIVRVLERVTGTELTRTKG